MKLLYTNYQNLYVITFIYDSKTKVHAELPNACSLRLITQNNTSLKTKEKYKFLMKIVWDIGRIFDAFRELSFK